MREADVSAAQPMQGKGSIIRQPFGLERNLPLGKDDIANKFEKEVAFTVRDQPKYDSQQFATAASEAIKKKYITNQAQTRLTSRVMYRQGFSGPENYQIYGFGNLPIDSHGHTDRPGVFQDPFANHVYQPTQFTTTAASKWKTVELNPASRVAAAAY